MNRIFFTLVLLSVSLSGCIRAQQPQREEALWKKAQKIHQQAIVFDAHAHGLVFPEEDQSAPSSEEVQLTPKKMDRGGIDGVGLFFAYHPIDDHTLSIEVKRDMARLREKLRAHSAELSLCTSIRGSVEAISAGKKAILPGAEYFYGTFEGDISQVDSLYRYGIRSITLMDNDKDQLMQATDDRRKVELNTFGRKIIDRMNVLGLAIDISHLDDPGQMQVIRYSKAPVIATHSSIRSVQEVPRNIPDSILKALAKKDGAIMITFNSGMLMGKKRGRTHVETLIDHIDHAVQVAGIDHVGLGSDFNGAGLRSPQNLENASGFPWITYHLLKRGYKRDEIEKILGGNYIRVMKDIEDFSYARKDSGDQISGI